MTSDFAPK